MLKRTKAKHIWIFFYLTHLNVIIKYDTVVISLPIIMSLFRSNENVNIFPQQPF